MQAGKVCVFIVLAAMRSWAVSASGIEDELKQGRLFQSQGKFAEARQKFQDVLGKATQVPEQLNLRIAALSNLANLEIELSHPEIAAQIYGQAIRGLQADGIDNAQQIENLRTNLAELYLENGDTLTAERLVRQVIASQTAGARSETADGAFARDVMACVYAGEKKTREAEKAERQALAILENLRREDDPEYAVDMLHLGSVLNMQKRTAEAVPYLERALTRFRMLPLRQPNMEAAAEMSLARAYSRVGRTAEAANSSEGAVQTMRNYAGASEPRTGAMLLQEAVILKKIGQKAAARRAQLEGQRVVTENRLAHSPATVPVEALLAQRP